MPVPLLDLNVQNLALETELKAAFERVLRSGHFILGPEVLALEKELAEFIGVKHAIGCSSGTDAILLALMALDIKPGDEVLCPSFTFFATAGCVARIGAKPVFVDSCPVCFNIDVADAAKKTTSATKAIIPVHLFGQSADMDGVMALAKEKNLAVIEDAAQALGASYKGKQVGSIGHFGSYSFFPSKNLGGFGDGGLLVSNDDRLAEQARLLRTHGAKPKYYHKVVGGNFRIDALQAALLRVKLPRYNDYTRSRQENAAYYTERLSKLPGAALPAEGCCPCGKGSAPKLALPKAHAGNTHIWNQYTLRVMGEGRRDALKNALNAGGIGNEIYYPLSLHAQECFAYAVPSHDTCPVATELSRQVISIPIFPELTAAQKDEVVKVVSQFLQ